MRIRATRGSGDRQSPNGAAVVAGRRCRLFHGLRTRQQPSRVPVAGGTPEAVLNEPGSSVGTWNLAPGGTARTPVETQHALDAIRRLAPVVKMRALALYKAVA